MFCRENSIYNSIKRSIYFSFTWKNCYTWTHDFFRKNIMPKIDGALRAVASGVESVVIKQAEALLDAGGTTIRG